MAAFDLLPIRLVLVYSPVAHVAPLPATDDANLQALIIALRRLGDSSRVAANSVSVHTPTMTLKTAALMALIGTILATLLLGWTFVFNFVNVLRGLAPPLMLFPWFVYAFACFSVAVFFYVFHRAQS
jgi:hypothetical protein